jgi:hypothetical protein
MLKAAHIQACSGADRHPDEAGRPIEEQMR